METVELTKDDAASRDTERPSPMVPVSCVTSRFQTGLNGWRLVRVFGPGPLREAVVADLHSGRQLLGREGDIKVSDPVVSRQHASLLCRHDSLVITNVSSTGALFVSGGFVSTSALKCGDVLRIGETLWVVDRGDVGDDERSASPLKIAPRLAGGTQPLLVLGETGSGKELLATTIHRLSGRKGEYVPMNCASVPRQLAEAELFGHCRGAFSDATTREGLIRRAHRGTLMLDELGELSWSAQGTLLRVLEDFKVRPLGTDDQIPVDVRVIAATSKDLLEEVNQRRFRADLYERLAERIVYLAPLRARRTEIISLFVELLFARLQCAGPALTCDAAETLLLYGWPGNVRELRSIVRTVIEDRLSLLDGPELRRLLQHRRAAPVWDAHGASQDATGSTARSRRSLGPYQERPSAAQLKHALEEARGNVAYAAELLGRNRALLYRWIKADGLEEYVEALRDRAHRERGRNSQESARASPSVLSAKSVELFQGARQLMKSWHDRSRNWC